MVKKLRRKFIITAMSALLVILVVLIAAINLLDLHQRNLQTQRMEERIASGEPLLERGHRGRFGPRPPEGETNPDYFPADEEGFMAFHRETEQAGSYRLLIISIIIGLICLAAMFLLVWLFSGRAVAPVVDSLEKQKRFLTDAGHELKTPLSVIKADVDVLELDGVQNEWTESIKTQVGRMNDLVRNMLALTRMEEEFSEPVFTDVDYSALVTQTAGYFDAVAETTGLRYDKDITPHIHVPGDAQGLEQLVNVLVDNAMKYATKNGQVLIRLEKDTVKDRAVLEVSNSVDVLPQGSLERLFDRFYRPDTSRNRATGGFGVGLSAAKAIVTMHDGSIKAKADGDHMIRFIAKIPCKSA